MMLLAQLSFQTVSGMYPNAFPKYCEFFALQ